MNGIYAYILQNRRSFDPSGELGRLRRYFATWNDCALERTGPYIPPITLPGIGDIILTTEARRLLESSGLTGFVFRPVEKKLIVEVHWENWDLNEEQPPEYPESGEPEDYVLGKQHSKTTADALGDLWEVSVALTATILRPTKVVKTYRDLRLDLSSWNGEDLIRGSGYGSMLFTERAQEWFTGRWGEYVQFDPFSTT